MPGYTDIIRKYATDDSRAGQLETPDGTGEVGLSSSEAGRKLAVRFTLQIDQERIKRARYQVFGCGFTIAACAAAAELAEGEQLSTISLVDSGVINQRLGGLPEDRSYCAELAVEALQAAVSSLQQKVAQVSTTIEPIADEHPPLVSASDTVYQTLLESPTTASVKAADRHLFACLLAVADKEQTPLHLALGLTEEMLTELIDQLFPKIDRQSLFSDPAQKTATPPEINPEILELLRSFVAPEERSLQRFLSRIMAHSISARTAHPGHLWVAMGLFERPQLTEGIRRHLPLLLKANNQGMRWKRFLFKQICELNGGVMCKSPNCRDCSDYVICFEQ